MSKARILADLISDSQITASEITGLELNAIQEGDTIVEVSDDGSGGKVVVRVDGADNAEFNAGGIKIPSGTTAQRDPNAALGSLRYNTTIGFFETFTSSGWGAVATPPSITSITPDNFNGEAGGTFTVDGAFFDPDTTAVFKGADGAEYSAATVTFVNNSQITVTNATNLPVANEPYKVKVTNGAGLSVESTSTIDAGTVPAFTTAAGSLASTSRWDEAVSVTVQASDAESSIASYAVTEGNLPSGLTLNGTTGAITGSGDTAQATTTYTFTIQATDTAGNTNTRQFSIQIVNAAPVWNSPAEGSTQELALDTAGSITLDATDPEGESVSYTSGALPAGLSLSGNLITGTPTVDGNTSVSVTASDGVASSVRNFFINVLPPYINSLSSFGGYTLNEYTFNGFDYKGVALTNDGSFQTTADIQGASIVVIGGGGAGGDGNANGGAGGAGGLLESPLFVLPAGSYSWTIGDGGTAIQSSDVSGTDGQPTTFSGSGQVITALGGGRGGSYQNAANTGGSGGGGSGPSGVNSGASGSQPNVTAFGVPLNGYAGSGGSGAGIGFGGGGGGAGGNGGDGGNGNGGTGREYNWVNGTNVGYAGGGSGASYHDGSNVSSHDNTYYGGGRGSNYPVTLLSESEWNGRPNTGGGGGGSGDKNRGHSGGSGVILLRFRL